MFSERAMPESASKAGGRFNAGLSSDGSGVSGSFWAASYNDRLALARFLEHAAEKVRESAHALQVKANQQLRSVGND